jgi:hypothetical protein
LPPKLQEANRHYQNGKYREAALLYEELFDKAVRRDFPQAPRLLLQAGFAWLKTENSEKGLAAFKRGFSVWIEQKQWQILHKASLVTDARLKSEGFNYESDGLQAWLAIHPIPEDVQKSQYGRKHPKIENKLPKDQSASVCPQCGAPLIPGCDWFNEEMVVPFLQCHFDQHLILHDEFHCRPQTNAGSKK